MCLIVRGESGFYAGGTELLGYVKKQWKWRSGGTRETTGWEGGREPSEARVSGGLGWRQELEPMTG